MSQVITLVDYIATQPTAMRTAIVQQITRESVFMAALKFVPVEGFSYHYSKMSELPGVAFRNLNEQYTADAGALNPAVENLAILGGQVSTDHLLEASTAHQNAITQKVRNVGLNYDYYCINGDPTVEGHSKEFHGLKSRLIGAQLLNPGTGFPNGHVIRTDFLDRLLDAVVGPDEQKLLIMSKYQRRQLKDDLLSYGAGVMESPAAYNGAKILVVDETDSEVTVLPQTETYGTSQVAGSVYCIRPGTDVEGNFVQGLIKKGLPLHKPLAQVGTTVNDLVEAVMGIGLFHGKAAARLQGLL